MDRNLLLSAAIAATVHGVVLLSNAPARLQAPAAETASIKTENAVVEIPLDLRDEDDPPADESSAPPPLLPSSPERIDVGVNPRHSITIPALPSGPQMPDTPVVAIPKTWRTSGAAATGKRLPLGIDLDNTPRARVQPAPGYPTELKTSGLNGHVTVSFAVDTRGQVYEAAVVASSHSRFAEEALRAVRRWRFEPGMKDGRPVAFRMVQTFRFSIGE